VEKTKRNSRRRYSKKNNSKGPKRAAMLAFVVMAAAAFTVLSLMKTITVAVDGKEYQLVTFSSTYAKALESKSIAVGPSDKTAPSLDSKIEEGSTIKITRATNLKVNVDGKLISVVSAEASVADMLSAEGIKLSEYDKVSPSKEAQLKDGLEVSIVRVTTSDITDVNPVAFETVTNADSTLKKGATKIVQNGVQGEKTTVTRVFYENGTEVSRSVVSEAVTKEPVNKVVASGTLEAGSTATTAAPAATTAAKVPATASTATSAAAPAASTPAATVASAASTVSDSRGGSLSYSKVFTMKATAYSEEESSNSWGLQTASGVDAVRDPNGWSTIAVDPSVIPLGTKVYVEGYGYAIANDTGSAIKGNIIDCFFYKDVDMNAWGVRTVNVYILK
jgi:uncharacterized protein YabE (DUF348 family)/3D (Asp-Asp-Asp) domain-containing protein